MQVSCQLSPLQIIDQALFHKFPMFLTSGCRQWQATRWDDKGVVTWRSCCCLMPSPMEWIDMPFWFAPFYIGNYLVNWFRVELERLFPYDFLDIFFGERWLLEIEAERRRADRFIIYLMKGRQVWVAKSLINCNATKKGARLVSLKKMMLVIFLMDLLHECLLLAS